MLTAVCRSRGCMSCAPSRMHLALKAYQELLLTVNEMDQSQDENIRQSSSIIKSKSVLTAHVEVYLGPFSGHSLPEVYTCVNMFET